MMLVFLQKDGRLHSSGLLQNVMYIVMSTKLPTSPAVRPSSNVYSCMELECGWSGLSLTCISWAPQTHCLCTLRGRRPLLALGVGWGWGAHDKAPQETQGCLPTVRVKGHLPYTGLHIQEVPQGGDGQAFFEPILGWWKGTAQFIALQQTAG